MSEKASILVGFSGGADSRALLDLLMKYGNETGAKIFAAHVNHGIRGNEADRDEEFCRKVAEDYGIPLFVHRADIPSLAKENGTSLACAVFFIACGVYPAARSFFVELPIFFADWRSPCGRFAWRPIWYERWKAFLAAR